MSAQFTPENRKRFDTLVIQYEQRRSALLPALYLAQEQWGYLSDEVLNYVALQLEMPPREVFEAVSFYVLFRRKPMGRYCIQVCGNLTCTLMGSEKVSEAFEKQGLEHHKVTEDDNFSLLHVQCLGSCGTAPVVQVNEEYFENMTPEKANHLIQSLRDRGTLEKVREDLK